MNEEALCTDGFRYCRVEHFALSFTYYSIYRHNLGNVLQRQVRYVSKEYVFTAYNTKVSEAIVMTAGILWGAGPALETVTELSTSGWTWWITMSRDGEILVFAFLQTYSEKSKTNLKASIFSFYLLRMKLLNIKHEVGKRMITQGHKLLAYLPTAFVRRNEK